MIVLSDGEEKDGDAAAAANAARAEGIRVISIAYGEGADVPLMQQIADDPDSENFYDASSSDYLDQVQTVFQEIAGDLCTTDNITEGIYLDGDLDEPGLQPFAANETRYIGFKWELPYETGNEIQTDLVKFDLQFDAVQRRHNPNP
jgi:hypothetical protein